MNCDQCGGPCPGGGTVIDGERYCAGCLDGIEVVHPGRRDPTRAEQALSILETLERLPPGKCIIVAHLPVGGWGAWITGQADHRGESATDALGQLTTVLSLEGG